ncbi:hypothetical protein AcV7_009486 [Taiwanofungus camphoratus]|nr:hypothetical protein AcV7_009486 [Antrodia cinnamomea]
MELYRTYHCEVLTIAIAIFRCIVSTKAPFPDTTALETEMAQCAWKLACERTQLNVSLTPTLLKMITSRSSHLRGELKTKQAEDLKHQYGFVYADNIKRTGLYKTEILAMAISAMWFANRQDEGVIYHEFFNPMPTETLALVLTAIECAIDEWATGVKEDIPFTAASYKETYNAHLRVLRDFDDHTRKYGLLRQLREHLHRVARSVSY